MDKCNTKIVSSQVRADNDLANITTDLRAAILKVVHARRAYSDFMNTPRIGSLSADILQSERLLADYHASCTDFYLIKDRKSKALLDAAEELIHFNIKEEIPIYNSCEIIPIEHILKATA